MKFSEVFDLEVPVRFDKFLSMKLPDVSRNKIQTLIKSGDFKVNGKVMKSSYRLENGDKVDGGFEEKEFVLESGSYDFKVLYEDDDLIVIDKPVGMVVHPSKSGGYEKDTVVNFLLDKMDADLRAMDEFRPGIFHRLDKGTSGVLAVAKTVKAYEHMVKEFSERRVKKLYLTLVSGYLEHEEGMIDSPIGRDVKNRTRMSVVSKSAGKEAKTLYKVKQEYDASGYQVSFLEVEILTGRTHQIRVHFRALEHPVVGDKVYGNKKVNDFFSKRFSLSRPFLHAAELEFVGLDQKKIRVVSDLSEDLFEVLEKI